MPVVNIKVCIDEGDGTALGRLADLYSDGSAGKGALINQCLRAGMLAREAGILEFLSYIDSDPDYRSLSPLDKAKRARRELAEYLTGISLPVAQSAASANEQPKPKPKPPLPGFGQ